MVMWLYVVQISIEKRRLANPAFAEKENLCRVRKEKN
jgi:hypothetical protein